MKITLDNELKKLRFYGQTMDEICTNFHYSVDGLWLTCGQTVGEFRITAEELNSRAGLFENCLQTQHLGLFLSNGTTFGHLLLFERR